MDFAWFDSWPMCSSLHQGDARLNRVTGKLWPLKIGSSGVSSKMLPKTFAGLDGTFAYFFDLVHVIMSWNLSHQCHPQNRCLRLALHWKRVEATSGWLCTRKRLQYWIVYSHDMGHYRYTLYFLYCFFFFRGLVGYAQGACYSTLIPFPWQRETISETKTQDQEILPNSTQTTTCQIFWLQMWYIGTYEHNQAVDTFRALKSWHHDEWCTVSAAANCKPSLGSGMFRFTATCCGGHLPTRWSLTFHRSSCTSSSLERLERLCQRLQHLQGRVRFPPLQSFKVEDETFQLPLKAVGVPAEPPERKELEYLVGFFDGDGSVSLNQWTGDITLQVDQNVDSAQVLMRFRNALGGGVRRSLEQTGTQRACLKWCVSSTNARKAASWLRSIGSMKQAQLEIAAARRAGVVPPYERPSLKQNLDRLRQKSFKPPAIDCSWAHFAGFFDADGCISVSATQVSLQLSLSQTNPHGVSLWLDFLHRQGLHWSLYQKAYCAALVCTDLAVCKRSLELLLQHGLLVEKEQAELALTLTGENHRQVREAMSKLKGHQSRYQRLDEAGMDRAKQIRQLSQKMQRTTSNQIKTRLEEELQVLRQEHLRQKLICKGKALRLEIRRLLREGATISPILAVDWLNRCRLTWHAFAEAAKLNYCGVF